MDLIYSLFYPLAVIVVLLFTVAYLIYFERKVIGFMQLRLGPNTVGWYGLLQPFADLIKLLCKEIILPAKAHKKLFILAPFLLLFPSLMVWSAIPIGEYYLGANLDLGLLFVFMLMSISIYGVLIAGWASNSKYAVLGAIRAAAQMISYEIAFGLCLVAIIMYTSSLNLYEIVSLQSNGVSSWLIWPLLPIFFIFWICGVAETNRAPFDLAEGESEIVAGFHVEYSGLLFTVFFLSEYANMVLISTLMSIIFLGGWHAPLIGYANVDQVLQMVPQTIWLLVKVWSFLFFYVWIRATLPRFRYDQLMRFGWKVLIPLALAWIVVLAIWLRMA